MKKQFFLLAWCLWAMTVFAQQVTLQKRFFTIHFDESKKVSIYTKYILSKDHLPKDKVARTDFAPDPDEDAAKQASDATYESDKNVDPRNPKKGHRKYDKGHLAPDADFKFSTEAEKQTMLYTNAAPQYWNFNEKGWSRLEAHVRDLCLANGDLTVYTGCIYGTARLNGIPIPTFYWKVVLYKNKKLEYQGKNVFSDNTDWTVYEIDNGTVERETGLTFGAN